jgi:hypothetical protein
MSQNRRREPASAGKGGEAAVLTMELLLLFSNKNQSQLPHGGLATGFNERFDKRELIDMAQLHYKF